MHVIEILYMNARTTVSYVTLSVNEELLHAFPALCRIALVGRFWLHRTVKTL